MIKQFAERNNLLLFLIEIDVKLFNMALAKLKEKLPKIYTVEEYLSIDRESIERYEYLDGDILMMAGESIRHGDISVNLIREVSLVLKGKNCRVLAKDTKTKSGGFGKIGQTKKGMFSYPGLVIVCGEPEFQDKHRDIVLNPKVIIEVLSESTELFDRTDKFMRYRMFNDTLTDYILVSQDKPQVEHFIRQDDNSWKLFTYFGLKEEIFIESIECRIKLSEIFDRVKFTKKELALFKD
ncbi:Uma2 family endonuclease [soil metagenome]